MIGVTNPPKKSKMKDGIRPVNLRTDLAQLADLIELVFRDKMDEKGRAAISEMRYLSKMGVGLNILGRLNDLAAGIGKGFVYVVGDKVVGNVSIYPAKWSEDVGKAWMIANVGTHPDYRQQGIARDLMQASIEFLERKKATHIILQVDYNNENAISLYESLEFIRERAFTKWIRSAFVSSPSINREFDDIHITHPRRSEWKEEFNLASATRPNEKGGIAWLRPLHIKDFRPSLLKTISNWFSLGNTEKLIIRDEESSQLLSMLWIERSIALSRTRLTLMSRPESDIHYVEALLNTVLRRYSASGFLLEHPHDETEISKLLTDLRFRPNRTVWHMRYDI